MYRMMTDQYEDDSVIMSNSSHGIPFIQTFGDDPI